MDASEFDRALEKFRIVLFADAPQNIPAFMALSRFLILEPATKRSGQALGIGAAFNAVVADKKRSGFARVYYAPYFAELEERKLVEPFAFYALRAAHLKNGSEWLQNNHEKVSQFLAWSRKYQWPKVN